MEIEGKTRVSNLETGFEKKVGLVAAVAIVRGCVLRCQFEIQLARAYKSLLFCTSNGSARE